LVFRLDVREDFAAGAGDVGDAAGKHVRGLGAGVALEGAGAEIGGVGFGHFHLLAGGGEAKLFDRIRSQGVGEGMVA